jgi:hypothetical protein
VLLGTTLAPDAAPAASATGSTAGAAVLSVTSPSLADPAAAIPEVGTLRDKYSVGLPANTGSTVTTQPAAAAALAHGADTSQLAHLEGLGQLRASYSSTSPSPAAGVLPGVLPGPQGLTATIGTSAAVGRAGTMSDVTPRGLDQDSSSRAAPSAAAASGSSSGAASAGGDMADVLGGIFSAAAAATTTAAAQGEAWGGCSTGSSGPKSWLQAQGGPDGVGVMGSGVMGSGGLVAGGSCAQAVKGKVPLFAASGAASSQDAGCAPLLDPTQPRSFDLPSASTLHHHTLYTATPSAATAMSGGPTSVASSAAGHKLRHLLGATDASAVTSDAHEYVTAVTSDAGDAGSDAEGLSQRGLLSSSGQGFAGLNGADQGAVDGAGSVLDRDEIALCLGYHTMLD